MDRLAYVPKAAVIAVLIFASSLWVRAQTDSIYRLPAGTHIRVRMDAEINSQVATRNDTFIAFVAQPVSVRDTIVVPQGTRIEGRVTGVRHAASGGRNGTLDLAFEKLTVSNSERTIDGAMAPPIEARSDRPLRWLEAIGGTAAGTAVGAAVGSAIAGAAAGAGAGIGFALLKKGHDVRIRPDQVFEIELKKEVLLPVLDY